MNRRTEKQESALRKRRNNGLSNVAFKNTEFSCQGKVGEFIGLYLICDIFATRLQNYYQTDKQNKKTKLNMLTLTKALEHFGLHIENIILLSLFQGGEGKRGEKSARQLRNGYLHQLSESDKNEIINKHSILTHEMKKLLRMRINT